MGSIAGKQEAQARHDAQGASAAAAATSAAEAASVPTAVAMAAAAAAQQQQPLSRPPAPGEDLSRAERASMLPSFLKIDTPASQNEAWNRLNNDPLLMIKKQEQESLKRIKENPVRMQEILQEVRALLDGAARGSGEAAWSAGSAWQREIKLEGWASFGAWGGGHSRCIAVGKRALAARAHALEGLQCVPFCLLARH